MVTATTAQRIKEAMEAKNLRQVDVLNRCQPYCERYGVRLGKSDLSQYISGKFSPNQKRMSILALGLGVNESWLMGYDVSPERAVPSEDELQMIERYRNASPEMRKIIDRILLEDQ